MRIAIVNEWLDKFGGAENVFWEVSNLFPDADLYCLKYETKLDSFKTVDNLRQSWIISKLNIHDKRLIVGLSPLIFRLLSLKKYDVVISLSHNFAHTTKFVRDKNTIYLSYIHTPSRSIWQPEIDGRMPALINRFFGLLLKKLDKRLGRHVNALAVNSYEVRNRVEKHWSRSSTLIHPPITEPEIEFEKINIKKLGIDLKEDFFVSAGRFVPYKKHDKVIELSNKLNFPLVIMGYGEDEQRLRDLAAKNNKIHFIIEPDKTVWSFILSKAEALIYPGHEDFGITPIEAIKLNTPVIALNKGGVLDYIRDGVNGFLLDEFTVESFIDARNKLQSINQNELASSVEIFSKDRFNRDFSEWFNNSVNENQSKSKYRFN